MNTNHKYRNYERTCIAPTGSISHIAGVSSGIEPNFTFAYTRNTSLKNKTQFFIVNKVLKEYLQENKPRHYDEILDTIIQNGGIIDDNIAQTMGLKVNYFKSTFDVSPEWHIKHQAVFQKYVDNAVSKTINVPNDFTKEDIKKAYKSSWELGCKGITIYRDKSRSYQILNSNKKDNNKYAKKKTLIEQIEIKEKSPAKKSYKDFDQEKTEEMRLTNPIIKMFINICCDYPNVVGDSGCEKCINCGWSVCS
jgi:ribonucleoside-diphosphate reductase alpha chain